METGKLGKGTWRRFMSGIESQGTEVEVRVGFGGQQRMIWNVGQEL